jgi:hypothetical protein
VNTDRLIDVLSANLEPVARGKLHKRLILALVIGGAAAFGLMLATVGPRSEIGAVAHLEWVALKLLFALSLIVTAAPSLIRSMRPGPDDGTRFTLILVPFLVVSAAAIALLLLGRPDAWRGMLLGAHSVSSVRCLLCIMSFAVIPLAVLTWALRGGAPTGLERCGANCRDCRRSHRRSRLCVQLRQRFGAVHCHLVRRCDSFLCFHRGASRTSVPALVIFAHRTVRVCIQCAPC